MPDLDGFGFHVFSCLLAPESLLARQGGKDVPPGPLTPTRESQSTRYHALSHLCRQVPSWQGLGADWKGGLGAQSQRGSRRVQCGSHLLKPSRAISTHDEAARDILTGNNDFSSIFFYVFSHAGGLKPMTHKSSVTASRKSGAICFLQRPLVPRTAPGKGHTGELTESSTLLPSCTSAHKPTYLNRNRSRDTATTSAIPTRSAVVTAVKRKVTTTSSEASKLSHHCISSVNEKCKQINMTTNEGKACIFCANFPINRTLFMRECNFHNETDSKVQRTVKLTFPIR